MTDKRRLATVWLGGCSGCHMSFLDTDEFLFELAERVELIYSPLADVKTFPDDVDLTLVEGAVANADNLELVRRVRESSSIVISFGDCAVTGNVTAMRNPLGDTAPILERVYVDRADRDAAIPLTDGVVPALLPRVLPVHQVIDVDAYLPGCPPPADRIRAALTTLLDGRTPPDRGEAIRFG